MKAATKTAKIKTAAKPQAVSRMSDDAVQAKTGKTWPQWFAILDKAGCRKMVHGEIVAVLREKHKLGPWWEQMVTVGYEQARGLREKHQKPAGFEISVSKTVDVEVAVSFAVWQDEKKRSKWLGSDSARIVIRKATNPKSMRVTWIDNVTSVEVNFYPKGESKSQVITQHSKLSDSKAAERMKAYWAEKLATMKKVLEN